MDQQIPTPKKRNTRTPKPPERTLFAVSTGGEPSSNSVSPYDPTQGALLNRDYYRNNITGKPYPGTVNFSTQRVLSYKNSIVRAIISFRSGQVAKLAKKIVPKDQEEPPRQLHVLNYNSYTIDSHPALDEADAKFLCAMYERLDPRGYITNKYVLYKDQKQEFTAGEQKMIDYLQNKHTSFYRKRDKDIRRINDLLSNPDPWFTETRTWEALMKKVLTDLLTIDRGAILIIRDDQGNIQGLMPVDGATLRPVVDEFGFMDDDYAYVQIADKGAPHLYFNRRDTIIMSMNPVTDIKYFGYGISALETLYQQVLADLYIDKGNYDYYRKGGSIPEGFISVEPPVSRDGKTFQIDQLQLDAMQRQMQSIMMGDYTQVPFVSGGKVSWIDFKGKRRDMQFKELALYLVQKICAVFQVSPQDVGIFENVNRSTASVQAELTMSKGLEPLMQTISDFITEQVISELRPEGDLKLWFENTDLEKEKTKWNMTQQQLVVGATFINEYRASLGKHPVPWGDTPLQGRVNWKPEEEQSPTPFAPGGAGGMPPPQGGGGAGLPPLPQVGAPGGIKNPGGPAGGANPMAGKPPQAPGGASPIGSPSALKSAANILVSPVAAVDNVSEEDLLALMSTDFYKSAALYQDYIGLMEIQNYSGGKMVRSPKESYEWFSINNQILLKGIEDIADDSGALMFSSYDGSGIVTLYPTPEAPGCTETVIKSLSKALYYDRLNIEQQEQLQEAVAGSIGNDSVDQVLKALEYLIVDSLDVSVADELYDTLYKFSVKSITDAQLEDISNIIQLNE